MFPNPPPPPPPPPKGLLLGGACCCCCAVLPNGDEAAPNPGAGGELLVAPKGMVGGAAVRGAGDPKGENPAEGTAPKGLLLAGGATAGAAPKPLGVDPKGPAGGGAPKGLLLLFAPPKPPKPAMVNVSVVARTTCGFKGMARTV